MNRADIFLETSRMFFRNLCTDDLDILLELDQDPEVMRCISKGTPTSRQTYETIYLPRMLSYQKQSPPEGFWAAHLRDTSEFIGWFHLRPDKISPSEMELGYRLARNAWGRGLATEGSRTLIEKAFGEWHYDTVTARTLRVNLASQRVMKKAGLTFEADFVYPKELWPEWTEEERRAVKYSMAREKFIAKKI